MQPVLSRPTAVDTRGESIHRAGTARRTFVPGIDQGAGGQCPPYARVGCLNKKAAVHGSEARGIIVNLLSGVQLESLATPTTCETTLMTLPISPVIAQAAAAQPAGGGMSMIIMMVVLFGLMYFMLIQPQMKRQKEHRALIAGLSKSDEVVTNGGVAGRVDEVGDAFLTVEIAPNVKVKVQKAAVQQVLPKGSLKSV